jgi:hypothetical protein
MYTVQVARNKWPIVLQSDEALEKAFFEKLTDQDLDIEA